MQALANRTRTYNYSGYEVATTSDWKLFRTVNDDNQSLFTHINPFLNTASINLVNVSFISPLSVSAFEIVKKLNKFKLLKDNWDNNDGVAPNKILIDTAIEFVNKMDKFDLTFYFTAPGPNGEILVELKNGKNTTEVYFNEDLTTEMILYKSNEQLYFGNIDFKKIVSHLS
jgi:hypothetical protein